MVRINDGTEHVYNEHPLTVEIQDLLIKAGPDLLKAVESAHEICKTLNLSAEVVQMIGPEGQEALSAMRTPLVFRLMVFRDHLLPQSKQTVRGVRETLTYYFQHVSFQEFKTLLPTLKKKLEPHTERTGLTKNKFMFLKAELELLKESSTNEVRKVISELEKVLHLQGKAGDKLKMDAQRTDAFGTGGARLAAIATTLAVAKSLIITSGMIVAMPTLAPLVAAAGIFVAAMRQNQSAKKVEQLENKEKYMTTVRSDLSKTIETLEEINSRGLHKFTVCLQGCADFFNYLRSQLETLSSPDGADDDDEDNDAVLKIMHRSLKSEASAVIKACREYEDNASQVESGIQVLERFKPAKYEEELEKWIKMSDEKAAELKHREVIGSRPFRT